MDNSLSKGATDWREGRRLRAWELKQEGASFYSETLPYIRQPRLLFNAPDSYQAHRRTGSTRDRRATQEGREHNGLAAVTVGEGAGEQAGGHARGGQSCQADAHEGERDADEVVEVDRGERVVEPLPEPEDQHRHQQEPDPSVELA